jgi:uncharacterized protein
MKILMTGGTGFVGSVLADRLTRDGHEVTILARPGERTRAGLPGLAFIEADPTERGAWQEAVREHDAAINLAGSSIFTKWTTAQKRLMRESRLATTRNLVEGVGAATGKPFTLLSTSAVGYYGFHEDEVLTEESGPGNDFLAGLALDWEKEALRAGDSGARVVITRFGIVVGPRGGAIGQMIPLFRNFVGGPIGSGRQWFSWVHMHDLVEAFVFLLGRPEIAGPVNVCAPNPVRNKELARALGRVLHRPSFFPAPAFMVRLVLGEFGSVILKGQRVVPRRLIDSGFSFRYPEIERALADAVKPPA